MEGFIKLGKLSGGFKTGKLRSFATRTGLSWFDGWRRGRFGVRRRVECGFLRDGVGRVGDGHQQSQQRHHNQQHG